MEHRRSQQALREETLEGMANLAMEYEGAAIHGLAEPPTKKAKMDSLEEEVSDKILGQNQTTSLNDDTDLSAIRDEALGLKAGTTSNTRGGGVHTTATAITGQTSNSTNSVMESVPNIMNTNNGSTLTRVPPLDNEGYFWFYYQDAYEDVSLRHGISRIVLFGKVLISNNKNQSTFHNCCVVVNNMQRNVFLLLKKQGLAEDEHKKEAEDAFDEFKEANQGLKRLTKNARKSMTAEMKTGDSSSSSSSSGIASALFSNKNTTGKNAISYKAVKRHYVFEREIGHPHGDLQFCKVTYDGSCANVSQDVGPDVVSYTDVFGTQSSFLEMLFKKRSIKGPMWLRIKNPYSGHEMLSHCLFEAHVRSHKDIFSAIDLKKKNIVCRIPPVIPPLTIAVIGVKTRQKRRGGEHEPVALCVTYLKEPFQVDCPASLQSLQQKFSKWVIVREFEKPLPNGMHQLAAKTKYEYKTATNERQLLTEFIQKFAEIDPDVVVQHNAFGHGLDILGSRLALHRVPKWDRLSRLLRFGDFSYKRGLGNGTFTGRNLTIGRLVCDTLLGGRELLSKMTNYEVTSIAKELFNLDLPTGPEVNQDGYFKDANTLDYFLRYYFDESILTFNIMHRLEILTLTKQLTNIGGNLWAHGLMNKRAERNEFLLIHEFHSEKYLTPEKSDLLSKKKKTSANIDMILEEGDGVAEAAAADAQKSKGPQYSGGLVLEPKVNLYDEFVLLLDFNSLYPSIIQEYNICFSSVTRPRGDKTQLMTEKEMMDVTKPPVARDEKSEGILPRVIRRLVQSRKEVKKEIKNCAPSDSQRLATLEIKQKAFKLVANSMYGCLGFSNSRFYAKPIAALITQRGRSALQDTVQLIDNLQYEVCYGDTDSVFVRSFTKDFKEANLIAGKIKGEVNKKYRKLEIDLDGIFQRLLLLKKKKYAALKVVDFAKGKFEKEFKGLDLVRRDWCKLSSHMGKEILEEVLGGRFTDDALVEWIHEYLRNIKSRMRSLDYAGNENAVSSNDGGKENGKPDDGASVAASTTASKESSSKDSSSSSTSSGHKFPTTVIPTALYVITKSLSKMPHEYADLKSQPHVAVAKRMLERGLTVNPGLEIPYLICKRKSDIKDSDYSLIKPENAASLGHCAAHPTELQDPKNNIEIDIDWYLKTQIHPPTARLLVPIEGTDSSQIAECLGLDGSRFASIGGGSTFLGGSGSLEDEMAQQRGLIDEVLNPLQKYVNQTLVFELKCPKCKKSSPVKKLLGLGDDLSVIDPSLILSCPHCKYDGYHKFFLSQITFELRNINMQKAENVTLCSETTCRHRTSQLALYSMGGRCEKHDCNSIVKEIWSQQIVQDQLNLLGIMLHRALSAAEDKSKGGTNSGAKIKPGVLKALNRSQDMIDCFIEQSSFNTLNLSKAFRTLGNTKIKPRGGGA